MFNKSRMTKRSKIRIKLKKCKEGAKMQIRKKTTRVVSASAGEVANISTWSVIRFPSAICTNLRRVGATVQRILSVQCKSRLSILNCRQNIFQLVAVTCCKFGPKQGNLSTQRYWKSPCMLAI
jgi:hypothetical protein